MLKFNPKEDVVASDVVFVALVMVPRVEVVTLEAFVWTVEVSDVVFVTLVRVLVELVMLVVLVPTVWLEVLLFPVTVAVVDDVATVELACVEVVARVDD